MPKTARTSAHLQRFHRFEFTHGRIDFIMDDPGRYRFHNCCILLCGKGDDDFLSSGEMKLARFRGNLNLAALFCPRCGTPRRFTWPQSEEPTFAELIKAVTEAKFPPNVLASQ
mgnify:CR=1